MRKECERSVLGVCEGCERSVLGVCEARGEDGIR